MPQLTFPDITLPLMLMAEPVEENLERQIQCHKCYLVQELQNRIVTDEVILDRNTA